MIEQLRTVITGLGWSFTYGRSDFQNLVETESASDQTVYFFLDPVKRTPARTSTGTKEGYTDYEGKFMILVKSDLDEIYDNQKDQDPITGKWQKHIRPIVESITPQTSYLDQLENKLSCDPYNWEIKAWSILDVINMFNENMDGVIVNYRIRIYS